MKLGATILIGILLTVAAGILTYFTFWRASILAQKGGISYDAAAREVTRLSDEKSPEAALAYVRDVAQKSEATEAETHALMHIVGSAFEARDGLDGLTMCAKNPVGIGLACYHGVMEAYYLENAEEDIDVTRFSSLCGDDPHSRTCLDIYHGIGHGLMALFDYDRPYTFAKCEKLNDSQHVRKCLHGANMEWSESAPMSDIERYRPEPWNFCTELSSPIERSMCALEIPRLFAILDAPEERTEFDMYAKRNIIADGCTRAPDDAMRRLCFASIGGMAFMHAQKGISIIDLCESSSDNSRDTEECLLGAVYIRKEIGTEPLRSEAEEICVLLARRYSRQCPT